MCFSSAFNLFQGIRRNLDNFFDRYCRWIYEFLTKPKFSIRNEKICHFSQQQTATKMQFVARKNSDHIKIETCRVLQPRSTWTLFSTRTSDWCPVIDDRATWISIRSFVSRGLHRIFKWCRFARSKSRAFRFWSWRKFMLGVWVKRLFCGCFDKSRRFFPAKNTFYMFNSW